MHYLKFHIYRNSAIVGIFAFCLTQLSGCSFSGDSDIICSSKGRDGPPRLEVDVSKIADAKPREESHHPYGARDYTVGGRKFSVLKSSKGYAKEGLASWYGSKFHGKQTSTQELYNLYGMTAASTELPLPSYVQVTNLNNGKKVVVRVNDRGPFHRKRIIDLSYAAAKKLDFIHDGVAPVKVEAIDPKTWGKKSSTKTKYAATTKNTLSKQNNIKNIYLQIGAFSNIDNAKQLSSKVNKLTDKPTQINHNADLYRVHVGPIACATQINQLKQLLKKNGFDKVVEISK